MSNDNQEIAKLMGVYEDDSLRLHILTQTYEQCCKETNIRRGVKVSVNDSMRELASEAWAVNNWEQASVMMRLCANDYQSQLMRDLVYSKGEYDVRPDFLKSLRDVCNVRLEWFVSNMERYSLNEDQGKFYTKQLNDYSDLLVSIDKAIMEGTLDLWTEIVWSVVELTREFVIMTNDPKEWVTNHSLEVNNYDNKLLVKFVEPIKALLMSRTHSHRLDKLRVSEFKEIIASGNGKNENSIGQLVSNQLRSNCKEMYNELTERREGHVRWEVIHFIQDLAAKIDSNHGSGYFWNVKWDELFEDWVRINQAYDALPVAVQQNDKVSSSQNMVFELVAFLGGDHPANKKLGLDFCEAYFKRGKNAIEIFAKRLTTHLHTVVKCIDITQFKEEDRADLEIQLELLLASIEEFSVDEHADTSEKWLPLWVNCTHFAERCDAIAFAMRPDPVATVNATRDRYLKETSDLLGDLSDSDIANLIFLAEGHEKSYRSREDLASQVRELMSNKRGQLALVKHAVDNLRSRFKKVDLSKASNPSEEKIKQLAGGVYVTAQTVERLGGFTGVNHLVEFYRGYRTTLHYLADIPNAEETDWSGFGKAVSWMFVGAAFVAAIWWITGK